MTVADANACSPVHRLPVDVVIEILGCLSYGCRVRASQAFALWRNIALAEATLWNVISIELMHPLQRLFELAARAKEAPLYVGVARQAAEFAAVQEFLTAHAARLVTFHCSLYVLAYSGTEEVQPAPEMPLRVDIPRCEQLMDLAIVGRGAQLRVDLDNARLPVLRMLNLSGATNFEQILPTLRTPVELAISLGRLVERPQLSFSALHNLVTNCTELRALTVDDVSDRTMTFDEPATSGTPLVLETVVLGLDEPEPSRADTARILRSFTAETVVVKRSGRGMATGMLPTPSLQMMGMRIENDFGELFQELEGPVVATIAPSSVTVNKYRPPHRTGTVLLAATDRRQFHREVGGIGDPRHVLVASGLASRIQRLDCSVRVWFNRLGVIDRNPANHVYHPQPPTPVFPELTHLILLYDDEPNTKAHVSMPVCAALRTVYIWEVRPLPEPRALDAEAVDTFLESVVGTGQVQLESATFVGPVTGPDSSDTVPYRCAKRVEFKTVPRAVDTRQFQSQGQVMSCGTMEPFDEDEDWL